MVYVYPEPWQDYNMDDFFGYGRKQEDSEETDTDACQTPDEPQAQDCVWMCRCDEILFYIYIVNGIRIWALTLPFQDSASPLWIYWYVLSHCHVAVSSSASALICFTDGL